MKKEKEKKLMELQSVSAKHSVKFMNNKKRLVKRGSSSNNMI